MDINNLIEKLDSLENYCRDNSTLYTIYVGEIIAYIKDQRKENKKLFYENEELKDELDDKITTIESMQTQLNRLKECYNCEIVRGRPCCGKCLYNDFSSDSTMEEDYWREHLGECDEVHPYE